MLVVPTTPGAILTPRETAIRVATPTLRIAAARALTMADTSINLRLVPAYLVPPAEFCRAATTPDHEAVSTARPVRAAAQSLLATRLLPGRNGAAVDLMITAATAAAVPTAEVPLVPTAVVDRVVATPAAPVVDTPVVVAAVTPAAAVATVAAAGVATVAAATAAVIPVPPATVPAAEAIEANSNLPTSTRLITLY